MLKHCRLLVDQRQRRHSRRRLYAPRIKWAGWLFSGGEQDEALPAAGRKSNRQGTASGTFPDDDDSDDALDSKDDLLKANSGMDEEQAVKQDRHVTSERKDLTLNPSEASAGKDASKGMTLALRFRGTLADAIEWLQQSDDFLYAWKLTVAVMLVSWPAFVASWNTWFSLSRGGKSPHKHCRILYDKANR